ncbi:MAG TPA: FecR domain-containing protein [Gemmatimonadales bacterium]|nr:FecR domain-containing protein [Gemmatimonadales bacterium]
MSDIDDLTLARYLSGECTPEEARAIQGRIAGDPVLAERVAALWEAWTTPRPRESWNADKMWRGIARHIAASEAEPALSIEPAARTRPAAREWPFAARRRWMHAAAAAAIVIAGSAAAWLSHREAIAPAPAPAVPEMREVATARGQRASIRLGDGTAVVLDADSKLRVPAAFGTGPRIVQLTGQAYFEVTHDAARPFIVQTNDAIAEDLGTEFVIRAYPGEAMRVVVAGGVVALAPAAAPTRRAIVTAGQLGELAGGEPRVREVRNLDRYLGWKDGRLVFRDAPLADVLPELERWYDVELIVPPKVRATYRLTTVLRNEPLPEMLDVLSAALNLPYERNGRTVRFHAAPRPQ